MDKYAVVFGGCSLDNSFKQNADLSYNSVPDKSIPGGKGSNQAVALARAGQNVKMVSIVGNNESGNKIIENLNNNNVDTSNVIKLDGIESDSCNIFVSVDGDNDIQRSSQAIKQFTPETVKENAELLKGAKVVVTQSKLPREVYVELIDFCYENKISIVLTPCPSSVLKCSENGNEELLKKVSYITANKKEALEISECDNIFDAIKKFPNLIVTAGEEGVYFFDNSEIVHVPAQKPEQILDTTGAGDTFCGNFVASLMNNDSKIVAVKRGICASTIKLSKMGAQPGMPTKQELDGYIKKNFEIGGLEF